jgi:alpha,alpha-trehalose phosphorylase
MAGFGGLRDHGGQLGFMPRLPEALTRLAFKVRCRHRTVQIEVGHEQATYTLLSGEPIAINHHGDVVELEAGRAVVRRIPRAPRLETPTQPAGRAPVRRRTLPQPESTSRSAGSSSA